MKGKESIIDQIQQSVASNTFVRLTLSNNRDKTIDLKKVIIKLARIKNELNYSFTYRHQTKDITKNHLLPQGLAIIQKLIDTQFLNANLFTTKYDWTLEISNKGVEKIRQNKPTFKTVPDYQHDKSKKRLINNTNYLQELGVLNQKGGIQKDKGNKYKQINKFVEIIDGLVRQHPILSKKENIKVVDMGAGKGYLTFALYDYLVNTLNNKAQIKGIEIRPDLITKCNRIAKNVGFEGLTFEEGYISEYKLANTDILIALHACDTATDDAIYKGIKAKAELIICAPCCHKQIRQQIKGSTNLEPLLNYGILKERQAEMITDTIRALLLESAGYKTKVFEFISTEHTGKNVMIVGQKQKNSINKKVSLSKIERLKAEFGIDYHYLERLMK